MPKYLLKLQFCRASIRSTNQFIGLCLLICYFNVRQLWKSALLTSKMFSLNCRLHAISERLWLKKGRKWLVTSFLCHRLFVVSVVPVIGCIIWVVFPVATMGEFCAIITYLWIKNAVFWKIRNFRKFDVLKIPIIPKNWCREIFNKYETQFHP